MIFHFNVYRQCEFALISMQIISDNMCLTKVFGSLGISNGGKVHFKIYRRVKLISYKIKLREQESSGIFI